MKKDFEEVFGKTARYESLYDGERLEQGVIRNMSYEDVKRFNIESKNFEEAYPHLLGGVQWKALATGMNWVIVSNHSD